MGDIASIIAGVPTLDAGVMVSLAIAVFSEMRKNSRLSLQQKQATGTALAKAYNATESYYALRAAGAARSIDKEHQIAALWDEIAMIVLQFNESLANRLGLKSRFWREGAAWSDEQINAARISLPDIRRECRNAARRKT